MNQLILHVRAPGKLMIAGEYAVLEHSQQAIVAAVNQYVRINVTNSQKHLLCLPDLHLNNLTWEYSNDEITFNLTDSRLRFVKQAFEVVYKYLGNPNILRVPFKITIKSQLDDKTNGNKYGLGSSAAVVVGMVTALLHLASPLTYSSEVIFKLAAVAHFRAQGSGSGADIAASTFGGWLSYTSFGPQWLKKCLESRRSTKEIIDSPWPHLSVTRFDVSRGLSLCVGWAGNPASTGQLIKRVQRWKTANPGQYSLFLQESAHAVKNFLKGQQTNNTARILTSIMQNREALVKLGKYADVPIETLRLATLANLAEKHGGAGKPSGAGGGDCGIALINQPITAKLKADWKEAGIVPLPIQVTNSGVSTQQVND